VLDNVVDTIGAGVPKLCALSQKGPTQFGGGLYCYSASAACPQAPYMFIVDDPLLALILRFVADTDQSPEANEEFLRRQIKTLRQHLAKSPTHEHGARAMAWIEQHAERYRRDRQRHAVSRDTVYLRCDDCPLASRGAAEHCEIHEQWLYLLRQYTADQVSSRGYIESALDLLRHYKEDLKLRSPEQNKGTGQPSKSRKKKKKKKGKKKDLLAKRKSSSGVSEKTSI